jgi:hypothetical protein
MVTLSVDPHPGSHKIVTSDPNGSTLASITVPDTLGGLANWRPMSSTSLCADLRGRQCRDGSRDRIRFSPAVRLARSFPRTSAA